MDFRDGENSSNGGDNNNTTIINYLMNEFGFCFYYLLIIYMYFLFTFVSLSSCRERRESVGRRTDVQRGVEGYCSRTTYVFRLCPPAVCARPPFNCFISHQFPLTYASPLPNVLLPYYLPLAHGPHPLK
jgi:hypothetical protein